MLSLKEKFIDIGALLAHYSYQLEHKTYLYAGLIAGVLFAFTVFKEREKSNSLWAILGTFICAYEVLMYIVFPKLTQKVYGEIYRIDNSHFYLFGLEVVIGFYLVWLAIRYLSPQLEQIKQSLTKSSSIERNRKTDIRSIEKHLPSAQKTYNPIVWFNQSRIFLGLNKDRKPVLLTLEKWRRSHVQITGTTGSGKGVFAGVVLTQAVAQKEAVVILDPKDDEYLPHVMYEASKNAGVPYVFVDLRAEIPQWNPLFNKSTREIEELLGAGFSLGEKGTDADFYRLDDRRALRIFANMLPASRPSIEEAHAMLATQIPDVLETGKKFCSDLEEIGSVTLTQIEQGIDIEKLLEQGAVIYVRGTMRDPKLLKLQRIFALSVIQFIEARQRETARHVCLFLDEFKYLISRPTIEALGAIRDKRAHVIIAHQSLGDLRECPADLDPEVVVSSVNENCAIKVTYAVKDPNTAEWLSKMSGQILVDEEVRQVKRNAVYSEVRDGERTLRQAERSLFDTNMIQSLPERCAIVFGDGLAKCIFTSPVPVKKTKLAVIVQSYPSSKDQDTERQSPEQKSTPSTLGRKLLDVD